MQAGVDSVNHLNSLSWISLMGLEPELEDQDGFKHDNVSNTLTT